MPIDASIYGQLQPPRINTPFENLSQVMQLRNQEEAARGLREQREAIAEQRRAQTEATERANAEATAVRALFARPEQPPTMEELSAVIDPERATKVFQGFEAVKAARTGNAKADIERIAAVTGGLEALPEEMRQDAYAGAVQVLTADGTLKPGQAPATYNSAWVKSKQREALTAQQRLEQDKPQADYTLGNQRMSGATNQPIAAAAPAPAPLGSLPDFVAKWAADRRLDAAKLSAAQTAAATQAHARASQAPSQAQGPQPGYQWVVRDGKPVHTNQTQPGDEPLRAQLNTGDTAQDRQREARTTAAKDFLARLNELRTKINTKMGPAAGVTGIVRRGAAAIGMDPDVAEYERIRAAGGRALAVAIMGAQNLSDQDANAWAGMLPDARTDEQTAERLTTQVERMLTGMTVRVPARNVPAAPPAEPTAGTVQMRTPDGRVLPIPVDQVEEALRRGAKKVGG